MARERQSILPQAEALHLASDIETLLKANQKRRWQNSIWGEHNCRHHLGTILRISVISSSCGSVQTHTKTMSHMCHLLKGPSWPPTNRIHVNTENLPGHEAQGN